MHEVTDEIDHGELREKARAMGEAVGIYDAGTLGAKYIQQRIINQHTLDYRVECCKGTAHYAVIEPLTDTSLDGQSASLGAGPTARLRENGFMVNDIAVVDGYTPHLLEHVHVPQKALIVYIEYVGEDHPIIEYWNE